MDVSVVCDSVRPSLNHLGDWWFSASPCSLLFEQRKFCTTGLSQENHRSRSTNQSARGGGVLYCDMVLSLIPQQNQRGRFFFFNFLFKPSAQLYIHLKVTVPVNTSSYLMFPFLLWFSVLWITEDYDMTHMELCSKQKKKPLMTAYCTLLAFSQVSWGRHNFSTVLREFPCMLSTCWLLFLHSALQLIPSHRTDSRLGAFMFFIVVSCCEKTCASRLYQYTAVYHLCPSVLDGVYTSWVPPESIENRSFSF